MHWPFSHSEFVPHCVSQSPHRFSFHSMSTHPLPQSRVPGGHWQVPSMQLPEQQPCPYGQASPRNPQHESPSQLPLQHSSAILRVQNDPAGRHDPTLPPVFAVPPVLVAPPVLDVAPMPDAPAEVDAPRETEPASPLASALPAAPPAPALPAELPPPAPPDVPPLAADPASPVELVPASADDTALPPFGPGPDESLPPHARERNGVRVTMPTNRIRAIVGG
jgi:hypothetical protein